MDSPSDPPALRAAPAPRSATRQWAYAMLVSLIAIASLIGCSALDERQREWIFQPSAFTWGGAERVAGMEEVWIEYDSVHSNAPVRLNGLWLPQIDPRAPALLFLHGARWDIRSSAHRMRRMHELGFSVLGIDYRGFGKSTAALPSEEMVYEDAQAAWQWLAEQQPGARRFVFGHSLGSAIAVHLATEVNNATGLIVEGAFPSIASVIRTWKWGWLPLAPFITQRFDAVQRIGRLKVPLLMVHGEDDSLIPPDLGRALFDAAPQPKRFELVQGGTHFSTNAVGQEQYRQAINALFGLAA
jgi:uncharacterized protein